MLWLYKVIFCPVVGVVVVLMISLCVGLLTMMLSTRDIIVLDSRHGGGRLVRSGIPCNI